jgi:hypothetical protein
MTHPTPESALRLAREALESCTPFDYSTGHFIPPGFDERLVNRALEALAAADAQAAESLTPDDIRNLVRDSGLDWHKGFGPSDGEPNRFEQLVRAAYRRGQRPSAEPVEARWVSVEERLPAADTDCLVWARGIATHYVYVTRWAEQREAPVSFSSATIPVGLGWDDFDFEDVTHWMPLPAAPTPDAAGEPQESK